MAPLRRYLRITKYSVLEVRIFLEDPAFTETWLLRPGDPALPRVLEAVRPLVLPKLREENERVRGKGKAKKGVKDIVSRDEFDVSIFLTDTSTRHSVLTKRKDFTNKTRRIRSNSGKMTRLLGANVEKEQMQVADGHSHESIDNTIIIREEEDENDAEASIKLSDIPEVPSKEAKDTTLHPEERRTSTAAGQNKEEAQDISSDDSSAGQKDTMPELVEDVRKKSAKAAETSRDAVDDNKKKLLLHTTYDGFSIYGRILCLIVNYKKPAIAKKNNAGGGLTPANRVGQQMLEQWVSSQAVLNNQIDEMEDG